MKTKTKQANPLVLTSIEEAVKQLPSEYSPPVEQDNELREQAQQVIEDLFSMSEDDLKRRQEYSHEFQAIGRNIQQKLVHKSTLLKEPMQTLMTDLSDSGSVAKSLISLQEHINQIDPNRFNFAMSGLRRLLSKIPGVGTTVSRWMVQFQSVESVINDIVESLKIGQGRLERDNVTLQSDQLEIHELAQKLKKYIEYGQILDEVLTQRVGAEKSENKKTFIQKDILFPLRQRVIDLQQQLAVNQYGVVTSETIVQNNKELIRGVDRALNVTVVAFQTASALSVALEHQKTVLKGVESINDLTNDLLLETSKKLKDQGATIQKQASQASIDVKVLKQAFANVDSALNEVSEFRVNALPELSKTIDEMNNLNSDMDKSIEQFQSAKEIANKFEL